MHVLERSCRNLDTHQSVLPVSSEQVHDLQVVNVKRVNKHSRNRTDNTLTPRDSNVCIVLSLGIDKVNLMVTLSVNHPIILSPSVALSVAPLPERFPIAFPISTIAFYHEAF